MAGTTCARSSVTDAGPFYPVGEIPERADLTAGPPSGQTLFVFGTVSDASCRPAPNAEIVLWQADNNGRYDHPSAQNAGPLDANFRYFGRLRTDGDGGYRIKTILPAPYSFQGLRRAPHIHFRFSHGATSLITELYFDTPADAERRRGDLVWRSRDAATRDSMIIPLNTANPPAEIETNALWCNYDITIPS